MLTIVTRDASGLLEPHLGAARVELGALAGIAVHHSGVRGDAAASVSNPNGYIQLVQRFYITERGYSDIAYNYLVLPNGVTMEGRGLQLRSAANGGTESNVKYLSVLFPGDYRAGSSTLTTSQINSFRALRAFIRGIAGNAREVVAHSALRPTECPGNNILAALPQLRRDPASGGLPVPRSVLRQGSTGTSVRCLQQTLNIWSPGSLAVDGVFGAVTAGVVRRFQTTFGLVVDGIVGNQTWGALERFGGCDLNP